MAARKPAPARRAPAAGAWISDTGDKLDAPDAVGGYDQIQPDGLGHSMYRRGGFLHREDGPAVTWVDGTQLWYFEGKLHREDGPAVTGGPGGDEYWVHGKPNLIGEASIERR